MSFQTIEIDHQGFVGTVWLNRPDVRNAFNEQAIAEITGRQ
jgi:methylglutaconyl-CoA hydratase